MTEILYTAAPEMVAELIAVCERLREVLRAETALLHQQGETNFGVYGEEKSKLVVRYDRLLQALSHVPREVLDETPGFTVLKHGLDGLVDLVQQNAQIIEIRMKATRRVMEIVARAARKATQPTFTYGRERLGYGARQANTAAVAVNRVL
jgi:hypothetical protein